MITKTASSTGSHHSCEVGLNDFGGNINKGMICTINRVITIDGLVTNFLSIAGGSDIADEVIRRERRLELEYIL